MTSSAWKGLGAGIGIGVVLVGGIMLIGREQATPPAPVTAETPPPSDAQPVLSTSRTTPVTLASRTVTVYKTATCGCCKLWVDYMRQNGYTVVTHDVEDIDRVMAANGVPKKMESCHTALIDGYVVEGHVPVEDIQRMLTERPKIIGLSVPGMVNGAPGMPGEPQPYNVVTFDHSNASTVYSRH